MTDQPHAVPAITRQQAIPEVVTELPPAPPRRPDWRRRNSGPLFTGRSAILAEPAPHPNSAASRSGASNGSASNGSAGQEQAPANRRGVGRRTP